MLKPLLAYVHARAGYQSLKSLSRFSPAERTRLVAFAKRRHWVSLISLSALTGAGVGAWIILIAQLWLAFIGPFSGLAARFLQDPFRAAGLCSLMLAMLAVAPIAGLLARDRWLEWAIAKHTGNEKCHNCEYSLADISQEDQRITCPECGQSAMIVESRGTIPERVMG